MSEEMIRANWPILWALLMTGINLLQLILAKTYVKREEFDSLRSRVSVMESGYTIYLTVMSSTACNWISAICGEKSKNWGHPSAVSRISDLLLENELKEKN